MARTNPTSRPAGRRARGFTLIEVLVVIGILALLVGILLPSIAGARKIAWNTRSRAMFDNIKSGLDGYHQAHGVYPGSSRPMDRVLGSGPGELQGSQLLAKALYTDDAASGNKFPQSQFAPYKDGHLIDYKGVENCVSDDYRSPQDAMPFLYYPARAGRVGQSTSGYKSQYSASDNSLIDEPSGSNFADFVADANGKLYNEGTYYLIGAGLDRTYFTDDDIKNFHD